MSATEVEDDIYAGYNNYPSVYNIQDLEEDELFQEVVKTSYGKRSIVSITISRYIYYYNSYIHFPTFYTAQQYLSLNCIYD